MTETDRVSPIRPEMRHYVDQALKSGGGGGTSDGMGEDALKPRVDFLHTAFLWLAGALVTAIVAIIGVNLTLASSSNGRIDKIVEAGSTMNRQLGEQTVKTDEVNRRLERIEGKIDQLIQQRAK